MKVEQKYRAKIDTIVPLKLDFAAEKGGAWPSRRVDTGLLSRRLPIGTKGAERSTQARRAVPLY
jgi:hypothetical protein